MTNSVRQIIFKLSIFLLINLLLVSCNNNQKVKNEIKHTIASNNHIPIKKANVKNKFVTLNNGNLIDELTRYGAENKETLLLLKTTKGNMKIKLYRNTPIHRANMIRLIKNNFYNETMFYRVVNEFMIQGGDNDDWSRQSIKKQMGNYTIPAEFRANNIHKKGALSMARDYDDNPDKRSSSFDFFIIQGTKYTQSKLRSTEMEYKLNILPKHKEIYKRLGGCPHLDGQHTVFGQVIEGLNIIDSIAAVKVDKGDWPIEDITIKFEILN